MNLILSEHLLAPDGLLFFSSGDLPLEKEAKTFIKSCITRNTNLSKIDFRKLRKKISEDQDLYENHRGSEELDFSQNSTELGSFELITKSPLVPDKELLSKLEKMQLLKKYKLRIAKRTSAPCVYDIKNII